MTNDMLYPLDLTGTQPTNRITHEKHTVSPPSKITQSSFIVLRSCPAFADTVVVKDGTGPTARTLVRGEDYLLTHKSIALTLLCKKPIYASIMFNDRNYTGTVYVNYQTVGGEYTLPDYSIVEKLTRQKYVITSVSFDQIVGLPASFPNPPHQHAPEDMVGLSAVVDKLKDIAAALRNLKGSYGVLDETVRHHLSVVDAHTPDKVGLSLLRNYGVASIADYALRAVDKYTTPDTVFDVVSAAQDQLKADAASKYVTKVDAQNSFVTSQTVYNKTETNNLFYTRAHIDATFTKKVEALTAAQVGSIVHDIVDMSQYYTRTEAQATYYTRELSDNRYYTKTQTDNTFVTQTQADIRYVQTTDAQKILSSKKGNQLYLENQQFYVGLQAPIDVAELYIDAINGSDNGAGTRASPFQTLKRAHEVTPSDKDSVWYLKHYTYAQLAKNNSYYLWDFDHRIEGGATRTLSVYSHTWIDGAKNAQATQLADGKNEWMYLEQITRVPLYLRSYKNLGGNAQSLYHLKFLNGHVVMQGIILLKPKPVDAALAPITGFYDQGFLQGSGSASFKGCYLTQVGEYQSAESTGFKWLTATFEDELKLSLSGVNLGYVTEQQLNGIDSYVFDFTTAFGYAEAKARPFQYQNTIGRLVVNPVQSVGEGAKAAGGTVIAHNATSVLSRPRMIAGLTMAGGTCTNIQSNVVLTNG